MFPFILIPDYEIFLNCCKIVFEKLNERILILIKKQLSGILFLQILTVVIVLSVFRWVHPIKVAALIAALSFLSLGVLMWKWSWSWPRRWTYFTFWTTYIHLFVFTFPVLLMRLVEWDKNFSEIVWWGVSAVKIHEYSTPFYKTMMLLTFVDLIREFWLTKKSKES